MSALKTLKGVGDKTLKSLHEEALFSCEDIVTRWPKHYEARFITPDETLQADGYAYLFLTAESNLKMARIRRNLTVLTFTARSETGKKWRVKVYNQTFLTRIVKSGTALVAYVKRSETDTLTATRVWLKKSFKEGIYPQYKLNHITDYQFAKLLEQCLAMIEIKQDPLPAFVVDKYRLPDFLTLLERAHHPPHLQALEQVKRRLKYQELFDYQMRVRWQRHSQRALLGSIKKYDHLTLRTLVEQLPFTLTDSQKKALQEIFEDLASPRVMVRLLQGDTGSGKTIVAFMTMAAVISAGHQAAFMAPTELLAQQHFESLSTWATTVGFTLSLLTGSTPSSERKSKLAALAAGEIDGLIGTHALFSQDVHYSKLGLVITDEQHRFGVTQRQALRQKGINPDVLYLSATPIPRTLGMTLFGDMDVSTLASRPQQSTKIETRLVSIRDRKTVKAAMHDTLKAGEQIYIVAPLIDDADDQSQKGVETIFETVSARYKDAKVAMVHGRLSAEEKSETLEAFRKGMIDILVATSVIEVGIHAPAASLMIIYHAERFGYAQLHQLRGRVGRAHTQGVCLLIHPDDAASLERLSVMTEVYDGFVLSEYDFKQRGFGDLVGLMQSGHLRFEHANHVDDFKIMSYALEDAQTVIDEYITSGKHKSLIEKTKNHLARISRH